ncbi:MAG: hypothetical protein J7K73_03655 [Nanoarchaeota archaeon]|nr:hypothetical protein [Nanoarchaeota archaeon]
MAFKLFGKKKEEEIPVLPENNTIPVSQVLNMKAQGLSNAQIANQLRAQGYSLQQIRDALSQAEIKSAVASPELPPMPPTPELPPQPGAPQAPELPPLPEMPPVPESPELPPMPGVPPAPEMPKPTPQIPSQPAPSVPAGTEGLVDELQRIIEDIIEEKWKEVEQKISKLDAWKARVDEKVSNLSAKVTELNKRVDDFSKVLVSKTEEYKETINNVNTEMEALEKVMGKLIPGLAEEIKELRKIVEKMKKH